MGVGLEGIGGRFLCSFGGAKEGVNVRIGNYEVLGGGVKEGVKRG